MDPLIPNLHQFDTRCHYFQNWPHPILQRTKDETRIYVFVGRRENLVKFMNQMSVEQLFAEGKYMVVYLSPETANKDELGYLLWDIEG